MAGYMTKLQGYVFEGEKILGEGDNAKNGQILALASDGAALEHAAINDVDAVCVEVGTIYDGKPAARFVVTKVVGPAYFVENVYAVNNAAEDYNLEEGDKDEAGIAPGKKLRAHQLLLGEEFVTDQYANAPTVGTAYHVNANGMLA